MIILFEIILAQSPATFTAIKASLNIFVSILMVLTPSLIQTIIQFARNLLSCLVLLADHLWNSKVKLEVFSFVDDSCTQIVLVGQVVLLLGQFIEFRIFLIVRG